MRIPSPLQRVPAPLGALAAGLALLGLGVLAWSRGGPALQDLAALPLAAAVALAAWRPATGVALLIVSHPAVALLPVVGPGITTPEILAGAAFAGQAATWARRRRGPRLPPAVLPLAGLLLLAGVSVALDGEHAGWSLWMRWAQLTALACLVADVAVDHVADVVGGLVASGALLSAALLADHAVFASSFAGDPGAVRYWWGNAGFIHPNYLAAWTGLTLLAALRLAALGRWRAAWRWVPAATLALALLATLVVLASRLAWASTLLALAVMALLARRHRPLALAAAATAAAFLVLWLGGLAAGRWDPAVRTRSSWMLEGVEQATAGRNRIWGVYLEVVARRPLLGVGLGRGAEAYERQRNAHDPPLYLAPSVTAHNQPLHLAAELGLGAPLLLATALAAMGWPLVRRRPLAPAAAWSLAALAYELALMGGLVTAEHLGPYLVFGLAMADGMRPGVHHGAAGAAGPGDVPGAVRRP